MMAAILPNDCRPHSPGLPSFRRLIALSAISGAFALFFSTPAFAHRVEKRFSVEMRPVVAIQNSYGKIQVKSWNRSEVLVVAEHVSDKVEVDAEAMGGRIEVTTHFLSNTLPAAEKKAEYTITVPEEAELQIKNDEGNIIVERVSGDLTFETVASDVQLSEVAGYILVKTVGGSLLCVRCAGRLEVETISGNLKFVQPVSNNVRAKTYSGSIFFDGDFLAGGFYNLRTTTGSIEVRYTDSDSFDLRAGSSQGKLDIPPDLNFRPPSHSRGSAAPAGGSSFRGSFGSGAARVDLSTFSGTITLRKRQ
jgi:DUF4097 and DUF4098 domain-containing protein YvlB